MFPYTVKYNESESIIQNNNLLYKIDQKCQNIFDLGEKLEMFENNQKIRFWFCDLYNFHNSYFVFFVIFGFGGLGILYIILLLARLTRSNTLVGYMLFEQSDHVVRAPRTCCSNTKMMLFRQSETWHRAARRHVLRKACSGCSSNMIRVFKTI